MIRACAADERLAPLIIAIPIQPHAVNPRHGQSDAMKYECQATGAAEILATQAFVFKIE